MTADCQPLRTGVHPTIAFLPWLRLAKRTRVLGLEFVPWRGPDGATTSELQSIKPEIEQILSGYVHWKGLTPIENCTFVIDPKQSKPWNFSDGDTTRLHQSTALLFLSAISENSYFHPLAQYVNDSIFQLFFQRFTKHERGIALSSRRREGETLWGGYNHGEAKFQTPLQCEASGRYPIHLSMPLLDGLNAMFATNSDVAARLDAALPFFRQANTDNDVMTQKAEVILMASAFEQLLGAKSNAANVSEFFTAEFGSYTGIYVRDANARGMPTAKEKINDWPIHKKWIYELYSLRGQVVHGNQSASQGFFWKLDEHLTMAAFAFPLLVKLLLEKAKFYALSEEDNGKLWAIDNLLAATEWAEIVGSSSLNTRWQKIISDTTSHISIHSALIKAYDQVTKRADTA